MFRPVAFKLLFLLALALPAAAQESDSLSKMRPGYVNSTIINGDTIRNFFLQDITITASDSVYRAKYRRYVNYVRRTYPFAMLAKELVRQYELDLAKKESRRESKKYINHEFEALKDKFTDGISIMTVNEGKVLCKLIHRETGMTAYDIAYKYLGTARALMWQGISRTGGADLKLMFSPDQGDDRILETVIKKVEAGEIKVDKEPFVPADKRKYLRERKEYRKKLEKENKQKLAAASARQKVSDKSPKND